MANKIILKKTSTASKVPLSSDLEVGELAVNLADQKLYSKNAGGTVILVGDGQGTGDVVGGSSSTDNALARYDGTTGKLIQNSVVVVDDSGNMSGILSETFADGTAVTVSAGKMWYNGTTGSWNLGMGGGNITQQVGEELFVYGKASSAITDSPLQIIYQTGTVGASGTITFAPTISGITNGDLIIGVATENIALNGFGRITSFGVVHGITTNGTAFGETWANGDTIWYNPTTGNPTNIKPTAPNIKVQIGTVINAGSGGSGSFQVEINHGSVLGGTDSNVQLTSVANANILTYDNASGYWRNTDLTAGTGISISKALNGVLTVNNTGVTSVGATSPIASSGGATPTISIAQATTSTSGYLSSTDWNTFNNKGSGTVTSITAGTGLTGGTITTSGTVALATSGVTANTYGSSTAIPVITFDTYGRATSVTTATVAGGQYFGSATVKAIAYNSNTIAENVTVTSGNNGYTASPLTINSGYTVTVESGANWIIF